jgi:hypothetical protein
MWWLVRPGAVPTSRAGWYRPHWAGRVATDRGTHRHWSRWSVATWQGLIGPRFLFKFKNSRLNLKTFCFLLLGLQKSGKNP